MNNNRLYFIFFGLASFCCYANAFLPICLNPSVQQYPAASDKFVIWEDNRNGNDDIYGYNLTTGMEFPVCTQDNIQGYPAISGNIVVWQDNRNGNFDIYGYDLILETEFSICTQNASQTRPVISGNIVVWEDHRNGNDNIYGYDLILQTEFPICTQSAAQIQPAISGNIVVWQDSRNGNDDIYGYYLSTSMEFPVCTNIKNQWNPDISGNIVVWTDTRNLTPNIYAYNLNTSTEFAIQIDGETQDCLAICGNIIVWQDDRNGNNEIYGYNLSTQKEFRCDQKSSQYYPAISNNVIAWQDNRNGNWDIYGINLSTIDWDRVGHSSDTCLFPFEVNDNISYFGATVFSTGNDISNCGFNDIYDVWNIYSPTQGGTVTISTDGSNFDTILSVYEACGGNELACNDDYCLDNTQSKIVIDVVKGKNYLIRVAGFNEQTGNYDLLITRGECSNRPQSDINDDCQVDMEDFSMLAAEWLNCGWSDPGGCWE